MGASKKSVINKTAFLAAVEETRENGVVVRVVDALLPVRDEILRLHREGVTLKALWQCAQDAGLQCAYVTFVLAHRTLRAGPPRPLADARARKRDRERLRFGVPGGLPPTSPVGAAPSAVPVDFTGANAPGFKRDLGPDELAKALIDKFGKNKKGKK